MIAALATCHLFDGPGSGHRLVQELPVPCPCRNMVRDRGVDRLCNPLPVCEGIDVQSTAGQRGVDGSFGMAAIPEDLPPTCTCSNGLTPVQLLGPNITARLQDGRRPPTNGIGLGMTGVVHSRDRSCRGTPAVSAIKHVPDGVAEYTHPACSGQGPNENAMGLRNCGRPGMGLPVLC